MAFLQRPEQASSGCWSEKSSPVGTLPYWESHTAAALHCGPHMRARLGFPQPYVANHHQAMGINLASVLDISAPAISTAFPFSTLQVLKTTVLGFYWEPLSLSHPTPHPSTPSAGSFVSIYPESDHLPPPWLLPWPIFSSLGHCHGLLTDLPASAFTPLQSILHTAAERSFLNVSLMLSLF